MTSRDKRKLIKDLKPFWRGREKAYSIFRQQESILEENMSIATGEKLEFFYVDGHVCGIGHADYNRRKKGKNYFPLIHDRDLE